MDVVVIEPDSTYSQASALLSAGGEFTLITAPYLYLLLVRLTMDWLPLDIWHRAL